MAEYKIVGKRVPRTDSVAKATGAARFTADIALPRMLHGKILRSPHPHARILNIDTSRAERLPGVRAVVTAGDTLKRKYGLFANTRDQHFLAVDKVRYVGDEVAAVAAIDEDTAEEALELIRVEYEVLPAVFDPLEAMEEGAPQLHDHVERNIGWAIELSEGNPEEAFGQCDHVAQDRFFSQKISHVPMEPYGALASYELGQLHIWAPNMAPFTKRKGLSNMLGLPVPRVRIHHVSIGGAFGSRSDTFPMEFSAALLSMKSGRPVMVQCTQEETLAATRMMHGAIMDVKLGFKRDGTLWAGYIKFILDGGAYLSSGVMATNAGGHHHLSTYRTPNFRYEGLRVYTNKTTCNMHRNHPSNLT
ncbi:MAG: xanthine dehydrogenase family protein molybdopterin-binding subunit, partial [Dehalococcoidia bacterium]